jgi:DNA-binding transcriptional LysR family regulator
METRDLDYLLAVAKYGGIGKAAEALGISQPALTKAIQRLEVQVGLSLFERTTSGVVPTQAGSLFIARARKIAIEYEDALKEITAIRSGEQGILRIGYSPTVPSALVLGACRHLMKDRPAARLRLRRRLASDLMGLLAAGELDLVVAPEPPQNSGEFSVVELFRDTLFVLADDAHPLRRKSSLRLVDLVDQEWLLPGPSIPLRQRVNAAFRQQGLTEPKLRVETDFASTSLLHLLRDTTMLCIAGTEALDMLTGLRPLNLDLGELDLRRSIGVIFRREAYLSALAQRMIELLQERVS